MTTPEFILPASVEDKVSALKAAVTDKSEIELSVAGFSLVSLHIYYGMPDFPSIINLFAHQLYDIAPRFPLVHDFLDFWARDIEAPLREVVVGAVPLIALARNEGWRRVDAELRLN